MGATAYSIETNSRKIVNERTDPAHSFIGMFLSTADCSASYNQLFDILDIDPYFEQDSKLNIYCKP